MRISGVGGDIPMGTYGSGVMLGIWLCSKLSRGAVVRLSSQDNRVG